MLASLIDKIADKVRWGYLTAFILLLISYILTFYSSQQVSNQQEMVSHTTNVINTLDDLISEIREAESAVRGFIIIKLHMLLIQSSYNLNRSLQIINYNKKGLILYGYL